ncbi:hypothetical protein T4B_13090, partial [Trichinella pseudospiralis]
LDILTNKPPARDAGDAPFSLLARATLCQGSSWSCASPTVAHLFSSFHFCCSFQDLLFEKTHPNCTTSSY